jgi:hypothetical protein
MGGNDNNSANNNNALRVLQSNVWLDATRVKGGLALTVDAILRLKADVVSLVEVKNLLGGDFVSRLKKELWERGGIAYYDGSIPGNYHAAAPDMAILLIYPITDEAVVHRTGKNCIVRSIIDVNGRPPLAVYLVHLEYHSYSCYLPRGYSSNSRRFPGWSKLTKKNNKNTVSSSSSYYCWSSFWSRWRWCGKCCSERHRWRSNHSQ